MRLRRRSRRHAHAGAAGPAIGPAPRARDRRRPTAGRGRSAGGPVAAATPAGPTVAEAAAPPRGLAAKLTRWTIGPFGLKDVFTLVNLLSGVVAVHFAVAGQPRRAGYAIIAGFLFGDLLDGAVARATHTGNRFGGQFDTITDHFVHIIVPGLVLYTVYDSAGHATLGAVAFAFLVAAASLRHSLFAVVPFDFPLCWCGLPRTIAGFGALAFPLSRVFQHEPAAYVTGVVMVGVMCALCVLPVPYITHRGRALQRYLKAILLVALFSFPLAILFAPDYFFDVLLLWAVGYTVTGWFPLTAEERRGFREAYRRWSAEVAV